MIKFKGNVQGGWFVIRVTGPSFLEEEILLGEIVYTDPDGPDLNVSFTSKQELFVDYPEDLKAVQVFMHALMLDASA